MSVKSNFMDIAPPKNPEGFDAAPTKTIFALWEKDKTDYPDNTLIIRFIETHGGLRCRIVNKYGNNIPNGALFFIKTNIKLYDHINPDFGIDLVENNRLVAAG